MGQVQSLRNRRRAIQQGKLRLAITQNNLALCRELVASNNNLDLKHSHVDPRTNPALQEAALFGHQSIVDFLLEQGVDVNERNKTHGETALHQACYMGHFDIAQALLQHGADIFAVDFKGQTCLHYAATFKHCKLAEMLLDREQQQLLINARDLQGNTPLLLACEWGHFEIANLLLLRGASFDTLCNDGRTALFVARQQKSREVLSLMESWQAANAMWAISSRKRKSAPIYKLPFELKHMLKCMLITTPSNN